MCLLAAEVSICRPVFTFPYESVNLCCAVLPVCHCSTGRLKGDGEIYQLGRSVVIIGGGRENAVSSPRTQDLWLHVEITPHSAVLLCMYVRIHVCSRVMHVYPQARAVFHAWLGSGEGVLSVTVYEVWPPMNYK